MHLLRRERGARQQETGQWGKSPSETLMKVQGKVKRPLPARVRGGTNMGGHLWLTRLADGFPIAGGLRGPGECPVGAKCKAPDLEPEHGLALAR